MVLIGAAIKSVLRYLSKTRGECCRIDDDDDDDGSINVCAVLNRASEHRSYMGSERVFTSEDDLIRVPSSDWL